MSSTPTTWDAVPAAVRETVAAFVKAAVDPPADPTGYTGVPGLTELADVAGWRAGPLNAHWGGPRPLTNALVGAALGALAGHGAGRLAEAVAPDGTFEPGKPRRRFAYLGAALGALPAAYQGVDNLTQGGSVADPWPVQKSAGDDFDKEGADLFDPVINRDQLAAAVMADRMTPGNVRAATAGLLEAAAAVRGSPLVSPWDVARVAISAGSGTASGLLVGRTLGALAGLSREQQRYLQEVGWWSGVLKSTVPQALGFG